MRAPAASPYDPLAEALRGPSSADAASSLAYWRTRLERLPLHRVGARREARAMVVAWEARLRRAELERYGVGPLGRVLATAAVLRGERPGAIVRRAALAVVPRRLAVAAMAVVAVATIAFAVALAELAGRLL